MEEAIQELEESFAQAEFLLPDEHREFVINSPEFCAPCPYCGAASTLKVKRKMYLVFCSNRYCNAHKLDQWSKRRWQAIQVWRMMVKLTK